MRRGRRDGAHARSDTKTHGSHDGAKVGRGEAQGHAGDNARKGTQHVTKAQTKAIVDSTERDLGNNDGDHVGRKHGAGPHGVMAARDDLGAVNGNARHIGDLVGQDSAVDETHKEECHDEQPKRRALFDARPTHVNLGSSLLVLIAHSGDE